MNVARYVGLGWLQVRLAALQAMQYRLDFFLRFALGLFWSASTLVPLLVLFQTRKGVAGWSWPEALLVVSFFLGLKAALSAVIQPSVVQAVEHIRLGTLDFILLKPVDAQFLVSTVRIDLARGCDLAAALILLAYALGRLEHLPSLGGWCVALVLVAGGAVILYSLFVLVLSTAFLFVRIDNLSYLMTSIFDAARWPASIFRGLLALLFTFVIPIALMTTYPPLALLGRIDARHTLTAIATALVFLAGSRLAWNKAVKRYTSAGG